jgi:hypothetical protein
MRLDGIRPSVQKKLDQLEARLRRRQDPGLSVESDLDLALEAEIDEEMNAAVMRLHERKPDA